MQVILHLLLITACGLAESNKDRGSKLPFVADAIGNALPPPSKVPAPVGSPVNLLTPDRYEFYTFDESGELVKRLMTLEEIQAIVAAGEEGDSMVTFANDDQPTIAFNFSQPPSTKVHSVVTSVQNVLKAQMEAHKNKPLLPPTLDTPDVSDSWSLILPSIFGNTGVDIIPDKSSSSFTTPETETLEVNSDSDVEDNSLGKEAYEQINNTLISETQNNDGLEKSAINDLVDDSATTSTLPVKLITTVSIPVTAFESSKLIPLTSKKPDVSSMKTSSPVLNTSIKPHFMTTTTQPYSTNIAKTYPSTMTSTTLTTTVNPTTVKIAPVTFLHTIASITTYKPEPTTKKHFLTTEASPIRDRNEIPKVQESSEKNTVFEKISTFIPISTKEYVTESTTFLPSTTKASDLTTKEASTISTINSSPSVPTTVGTVATTAVPYISTTIKLSELQKNNVTTITTQSISPSTTISSTKVISVENSDTSNNLMGNEYVNDEEKNSQIMGIEPLIPIFDVAQSISQIASDLGGDFQPIPTVSNLLDTTKLDENYESKENSDVEISTVDEFKATNNDSTNVDKFVKISTLDPHQEKEEQNLKDVTEHNDIEVGTEKPVDIETTTIFAESTTIDPILNESMDDLISQVVYEMPQKIINAESDNKIMTTEQIIEETTESKYDLETESDLIRNGDKETVTTTEALLVDELITTLTSNEITTEETTVKNNIKESELSNNSGVTNSVVGNYVQISMSDNKNKLENSTVVVNRDEYITSTLKTEQGENKNKEAITTIAHKENLSDSNNNEIPKLVTTTAEIIISTEAPTLENKRNVSSYEKDSVPNKPINSKKETNIHRKDTVHEISLKLDEFKKKIQKVNIAEEELVNSRNSSWKLIATVAPPKEKVKTENQNNPDHEDKDIVFEFSKENQGLEVTTKDLSEDIAEFTELCNELAFRYWNVITQNVDKKRSFVLSPYSITSMLAMMFMGARGATSGEMNEILKLDDMVTFNPHFTLKNISDSIDMRQGSGIVVSAFIRELYSDRNKGKILTFYKERAQQFYNGHVEEINFKLISDIIRRRTNLLVKRYTFGKIPEYMKTNSILMQPPLAAFSANIFETDCTGSSVGGRDGEMYFVVSPNVRQRRLVPVPAVVYKQGFLAGYDPVLDATAAALGDTNSIISTLFVMPGQQGNVVHAEDLEKLEHRLLQAEPTTPAWNRLLRTLLPRVGLELQIPRFSHKSIFNISSSLRKMGLKDLFDAEHADLGGLNGPSKDLFLSDMVQMTTFVTCGEDIIGEQHHIEEYPEYLPAQRRRTSRWAHYWDEPRDYQRAFHDPHDLSEAMNLPLHLRPRQARVPARNVQTARLKYDRPFLFFTRHNPTGMILYVGRYNPRLLP